MAELTIGTSTSKGDNFTLPLITSLISDPISLQATEILSTGKTVDTFSISSNVLGSIPLIDSGLTISVQSKRETYSLIDLEKFRDASDTFYSTGGSNGNVVNAQFWS